MTDIKDLRRILVDYKRVAMVGLSDDWSRPSNFAAKYLLDHGFEVIPVNPKYPEILGQKCYALFGGLNTIGVNTGVISAQRPRVFNR
jgi:predicted CoA-binding protein